MSLTQEGTIETFKEAGALLDGHFIFTSGRHGSQFLQAARVLQYPELVQRLCEAVADNASDLNIELVVGPATGGIILAYETARHLKCRGVFAEKDEDGSMAVKRGFAVKEGTRVLVVEDIITTGGSVQKTVNHLRERGADVVAVSVLIDRSGGKATFDCTYSALAELNMQSWEPGECPLCKEDAPLIEPDDIILT